MITLLGLDSTGPVGPSAHHAIGSTVAIRYLSRATAKVVTRAEADANKAKGIKTYLVFEDTATNALGGYEAGKADAEWGRKQAIDILGLPSRSEPRFPLAVDFDTGGSPQRTDAYFDGAAAVLKHINTGPYGDADMVAHAYERAFRQLYGTYAWSGGKTFEHVQVQQFSNDHYVGGVGVDFDHCYPDKAGDFGQWDFEPVAPLDPYQVYPEGPFPWKGRMLYEKRCVRAYDHLRNRPRPFIFSHRAELANLRAQLLLCAEHIYFEAHYGKDGQLGGKDHGLPPRWRIEHLGHRYQGTIRRHQGERLHT